MPRQSFATPVATFGPFPDQIPLTSTTQLNVTDTRNSLRVIDGAVRDVGSGTIGIGETFPYGQVGLSLSKFDGTGWARVAGRVAQFIFEPSDRNTWVAVGVSPTKAAGDRSGDSFMLLCEDGKLIVSTPAGRILLNSGKSIIRPMPYLLSIPLGAATTEFLLSTIGPDSGGGMDDPVGIPQYPLARRLFVDISSTAGPLFPSYQLANTLAYPNGSVLDHVRIRDVLDTRYTTDGGTANFFDRVNRANSANNPGVQYTVETGTWGITNNAIRLQATAGPPGINTLYAPAPANGVYRWRFRLPATLPFFGLTFAHSGTGNYIRIFNNGGQSVLMQVVAGGVPTGATIAGISGPYLWQPNSLNDVMLQRQGNALNLTINGTNFSNGWKVDATNTYLNGSGIGMTALDNGFQAEWTHVAHYDHIERLPVGLRQRRNVLPIGSRKELIFREAFTGSNGTSLTSRGFTVHQGTATIQSNAARLTDPEVAYATIDAGALAFEAAVDIVLPPQTIRYTFVGLIVYINPSTFRYYRCAIDKVLQPDADEIERGWPSFISGKVQMDGNQYVPNGVRRLSLRKFRDGRITVYLDGIPRLGDRLPAEMRGAMRVGIIRYNQDGDTSGNPSVFRNFEVYRLGT